MAFRLGLDATASNRTVELVVLVTDRHTLAYLLREEIGLESVKASATNSRLSMLL